MKKGNFCQCAEALREYGLWERNLYGCGIDLEGTPAVTIAESLHAAMCDFRPDWSYDKKLGIDWIIEWTCNDTEASFVQERHGRKWILDSAGMLYDFLVFMNMEGWND